MSDRTISKDMSNVTFSQALEDGLTHSDWLDGRMTDPRGRARALVSHSALPEKAKGLRTAATFGPLFGGSSRNADLSLSLGSRLVELLGSNGSMEYRLTWKRLDTKSGLPIYRLRASAHRKSGRDCSGWPTPNQRDTRRGCNQEQVANVADKLIMAGWPTPRTITGGAESAERKQELGRTESGGGDLQAVAKTLGPTPSGGPAPTKYGGEFREEIKQVDKKFREWNRNLRLNPRFSLYLQGYPIEWASCAERVTR